jgi:hypothetical protein
MTGPKSSIVKLILQIHCPLGRSNVQCMCNPTNYIRKPEFEIQIHPISNGLAIQNHTELRLD